MSQGEKAICSQIWSVIEFVLKYLSHSGSSDRSRSGPQCREWNIYIYIQTTWIYIYDDFEI